MKQSLFLILLIYLALGATPSLAQRLMDGSRRTVGYIEGERVSNGSRSTIGYLDGSRVMDGSRRTIGYVEDGRRYVAEVKPILAREAIPEREFVRVV